MNRFAFKLSSYTLKSLSGFSRARLHIQGQENIPEGSVVFCANHFTRIETVFLPYHIHSITGKQIWSLAAQELFQVPVLEGLLRRLGAVSTDAPDRDGLLLKTLLSGYAHWIIFPEGMMVKNKKLLKKGRFVLTDDKGNIRPHTGAAVVALRCQFFRERLRRLKASGAPEFHRLAAELDIENMDGILAHSTHIVPVNITYYPANPRENILGSMAKLLVKEPSKRVLDELMTEGAMLFTGVDITIRFGTPIDMAPYLNDPYLESMLTVKRRVRPFEDLTSRQISKRIAIAVMERYMAQVYSLTTLNHDHVMASILKHYPYKRDGIDRYEFACKVYYAITCLVLNRLCYVADPLLHNQIHLLVDDRLKQISDFLALAEKTGVICMDGNRFFKDQTRFYKLSDFHAIRMENPILVMANEVEPVEQAQICLKKIAQKPYIQIRQLVKSRIIEKMNMDFTADYAAHYIAGESKKKRIGRPIFLNQPFESSGILLIHGYMAAPEEMKSFARYLHSKGLTVHVPRLKGHGTSPEDLARTGYEQWMESVEEAYVGMRHSCERLVIGGFSTGAGLVLELATRVADFEAIFVVAPPMRLNDMGSYFVPAIDAWNIMIKRINLKGMAKEFIDNHPENPHINYLRNPIAGIHHLEKLMVQLEPKLKLIEKPVLVVQSRKDPVVNPKGTEKLFSRLGSGIKEYYLFDYERHGILTGKGVKRVYQAIENFVRQWV
ncbi:MAG: alpha/beta fold hydrolase [Desulfotignum sp.]|nr:alpha/beta fold hydrolase [Desulfotignum sp.]MCF8124741.1 alpha/beta fold hydrolase [Desulfotignum sp.]